METINVTTGNADGHSAALPILAYREEILAMIARQPVVVVVGATGSGAPEDRAYNTCTHSISHTFVHRKELPNSSNDLYRIASPRRHAAGSVYTTTPNRSHFAGKTRGR